LDKKIRCSRIVILDNSLKVKKMAVISPQKDKSNKKYANFLAKSQASNHNG